MSENQIKICNSYLKDLGNNNPSEKEILEKKIKEIQSQKDNKKLKCELPDSLRQANKAKNIKLLSIIFGSIGGVIVLCLLVYFFWKKYLNKSSS